MLAVPGTPGTPRGGAGGPGKYRSAGQQGSFGGGIGRKGTVKGAGGIRDSGSDYGDTDAEVEGGGHPNIDRLSIMSFISYYDYYRPASGWKPGDTETGN